MPKFSSSKIVRNEDGKQTKIEDMACLAIPSILHPMLKQRTYE